MKRQDALSLRSEVQRFSAWLNNPDQERTSKYPRHEFTLEQIVVLSENTAGVIYRKEDGKKMSTFFYLAYNSWRRFTPTDSHILGMENFGKVKRAVENSNFPINFAEVYGTELEDPDLARFLGEISSEKKEV